MQTTQNMQGRQSLQNVMTPQLQEAIRILQLSYEELVPFIDQQLTLNPFLSEPEEDAFLEDSYDDMADPFSHKTSDNNLEPYDTIPLPPKNLHTHLTSQINIMFSDETEKDVALYIVAILEPTGYLKKEPSEIAHAMHKPLKVVHHVIEKMKKCDPTGICAATLEECLKLQLIERELFTPAFETLLNKIASFTSGKIKQGALEKACGVDTQTLSEMLHVMRTLDPYPGSQFHHESTPYIVPEVYVYMNKKTNTWDVNFVPHLRRQVLFDSQYYKKIKSQTKGSQDRRYLSQQLNHATWLCKALSQRSQTLLSVSQEIVRRQQNFFYHGVTSLTPLTLKDIAQPVGIHESTVSRITSGKYISTPHGIFELKYFFTSSFENVRGRAISSESLKNTIHQLILNENPEKPLSDLVITEILNTQSIPIARRTVAKYREALNVPPSFQRKRNRHFKALTPDTRKKRGTTCSGDV
ncbi:RNA polymerase factor sigma-54 [bacterium NHP-B]|nr:RNA polymerase factor sigma-54 [bacterium NHP-B]